MKETYPTSLFLGSIIPLTPSHFMGTTINSSDWISLSDKPDIEI